MSIRRLLPFAVLAMLFLASCTTYSGGSGAGSDMKPFIGGNVGLDMGLVDGAPPANVMDGARMEFAFGVVLTNAGEADVGPGTRNPFAQVKLEGFLPTVFNRQPADLTQSLTMPLLGAKRNFDGTIIRGGTATMMFQGLNYQTRLQGDTVVNFLVNSCYDYENFATVPICFKADIQETAQDQQICTLRGEKAPSNSGGPVQITSLVQSPIDPYSVMVNMVIEHVGTGDVYGRPAAGAPQETCNPASLNFNKNKVAVTVSSQDPSVEVVCSTLGSTNTGVVTLYQGAPSTVTCRLSAPAGTGQRAFTELVTVNMQYRYGESVMQPVVVQAVGQAGQALP